MVHKEDIYKKIEKEVKDLDLKVNNVKLYNFKTGVKKALVYCGLGANKVLPIVASAIILSSVGFMKSDPPFSREIKVKGANVAVMDTSTGYHEERTSFDEKYDFEEVQYSTAWTQTEDGLYSRKLQIFNVDTKSIDLRDTEKILSMTPEEIAQLFTLKTTKTIVKNKLVDDDFIYTEPAIVILNHYTSTTITVEEMESIAHNIFNSIAYLVVIGVAGLGLGFTTNLVTKHAVDKKLKSMKSKYRRINQSELDELRKMLNIKKENLELLQENSSITEPEFSPRRRSN